MHSIVYSYGYRATLRLVHSEPVCYAALTYFERWGPGFNKHRDIYGVCAQWEITKNRAVRALIPLVLAGGVQQRLCPHVLARIRCSAECRADRRSC